MTIAVETNRVVYAGNGATTNWGASFSAVDEADIEVYLYEISSGDLTLLSDAVYNINGVPGDTFSVDYPLVGSPVASTHKVIIQRIVPLLQPAAFSNAAGFDPATLTEQLDEMVRGIQQVSDAAARAVKVDISGTDDPDDFLTDLAASVAAAAASAAAAATAETNAETAETNAETAETNAAASATAAAIAETNAETAETNAEAAKVAAEAARDIALGATPSLFFTFDDATADADPGAGEFRLNHATIASATAAYIDNADALGTTVSAIIDGWDDSSNTVKGQLLIRSKTTLATLHVFNVTGSVVDGTGYRKITLAYVGGSGALAAAEQCLLMFLRAGDAGAGGGDVDGPASATDNAIVLFDGTTGKLLKDSAVLIASLLTEAEASANYQPLAAALTALATAFTVASASGAAGLAFAEDTDNGAHAITLKAPASVVANADVTLPAVAGTLATLAGTETFDNKSLTDPSIIGTIKEDVFVITDAAGYVINPSDGAIQRWTLGASRTPGAAHANWTDGKSVTLLIADGTAFTITWTTLGVVWKSGVAPTLATSGYTEINIIKENGVLRGVHVGDFAS